MGWAWIAGGAMGGAVWGVQAGLLARRLSAAWTSLLAGKLQATRAAGTRAESESKIASTQAQMASASQEANEAATKIEKLLRPTRSTPERRYERERWNLTHTVYGGAEDIAAVGIDEQTAGALANVFYLESALKAPQWIASETAVLVEQTEAAAQAISRAYVRVKEAYPSRKAELERDIAVATNPDSVAEILDRWQDFVENYGAELVELAAQGASAVRRFDVFRLQQDTARTQLEGARVLSSDAVEMMKAAEQAGKLSWTAIVKNIKLLGGAVGGLTALAGGLYGALQGIDSGIAKWAVYLVLGIGGGVVAGALAGLVLGALVGLVATAERSPVGACVAAVVGGAGGAAVAALAGRYVSLLTP
jgi:hypothetical protein